jgi:sugar lactone lactonase YvrE
MVDMIRAAPGSLMAIILSFHAFAAPSLIISNFAGNGTKGYSGDGGVATEAQLNFPTGISRGPDGALYICDTGNHRVRKVARDGIITTIAGTGVGGWSGDGGPAIAAKLNEPYEVRFDSTGNIYWVERLNHAVRKLNPKTGIISTIAGSGTAGFSGDGGPAVRAQLNEPHSIGFDKADNLYICDVKNHRIRKVDTRTGTIATCAGTGERKPTPDGADLLTAPLNGPRALDFDQAGRLWVALREGNAIFSLDLDSSKVYHEAGTGRKGFTGNDGPAKEAELSGPKGLAVARSGNIYFADTESHTIRMIDPRKKTIHLVAGTGTAGDGSESDPLKCQLARPHGIFVDQDDSIFVGDSEAQRVRVIRFTNR